MGGKNSLKVINHDQKLFIEWVDGFLSSFINVSKLEFCRFYSIKFIFGPPRLESAWHTYVGPLSCAFRIKSGTHFKVWEHYIILIIERHGEEAVTCPSASGSPDCPLSWRTADASSRMGPTTRGPRLFACRRCLQRAVDPPPPQNAGPTNSGWGKVLTFLSYYRFSLLYIARFK